MTLTTVLRMALPEAQTRLWARNGRPVDAWFQHELTRVANHAAKWRTKQLFSYSSGFAGLPASAGVAGTRTRVRGAFRTSQFARHIVARIVAAPHGNTGMSLPAAGSPAIAVVVRNGGGSQVAGLTYGYYVTGDRQDPITSLWDMGTHTTYLLDVAAGNPVWEVTPDTEYFMHVDEVDDGRLFSISLFEESLEPTLENGYLPDSYAAGAPIFDEDRGDLATVLRNLYKKSAAPLWNWCVDIDSAPRTRVSTTGINVIDNSSTTVSAATPGPTLDLRNRNRESATTVPCVFKCYARSQGLGSSGNVKLKDSGGTAVATIALNSTLEWKSTTVDLPATLQKLDLHLEGDGANAGELYAVSLYQYIT